MPCTFATKSIIKYVPDDLGQAGGDNIDYQVTNLHAVAGALKTKSQCFRQNTLKIYPG